MCMTKERLLSLFEIEDTNQALEAFYQSFGPSVRSEYKLDGSDIIDLDWEMHGCVVSFVDARLAQVRLIAHHESGYIFQGWMGDAIPDWVKENHLQEFSYNGLTYKMHYEFLNDQRLESLTLCVKA